MARAKINLASINKKVSNSKKFLRASDQNAQKKFDLELKRMLEDFNQNPITVELENPSLGNVSDTLGALNVNLFNFIGFYAGDNPVSDLRNLLLQTTTLSKQKSVKLIGRKPRIEYRVNTPNSTAIKSVTKMPWSSKSWAFAVETGGISGFNYFLNVKSRSSRSGKGIQANFDRDWLYSR